MKLHKPTKVVFLILSLLMLSALTFVAVNYQNLKKPLSQGSHSAGTCSPDLANCQGSPELCMEMNKNQVCN